ncbi:MAG: xanthine dehydrogenase family protein molybdopterin-binding subunit [Proteobacteria bacterium]|nr:xanthine dehydrogenase family protein molybdopterin-binding subunit [Pseudomonadota bacterium]
MNSPVSLTSRRQFLQASTAVGGGLLIGLYLPPASVAGDLRAVAPNAWVRITPDNRITLICHRNEMGQDVHTSLALLVAEELGVDVNRVTVEQAPVDPVYVNALLGAQITGGSTSIRDAWTKLREAGATARVLLTSAAARRWQVPVEECIARDGVVRHAGGRSATFGELADAASRLPGPVTVALKKPADFTQIGKQQHRLDSAPKARGQAVYGLDVKQPGMVYASLEQCPVIGGKVVAVDDGKARAMKGVLAVVNIGEGVAVVADHYWTAKKAREALQVTWDFGPAAALTTQKIQSALRQAATREGAIVRQAGDAALALRGAAKTLRAEYQLQLLAHGTLEPMNCLALVGERGCDIWASTQYPQGAQAVAASRSGVEAARVRVWSQFVGGGFGRRLDVDFIGQAAAIARAVPGRPVKLIWTREDDIRHDFYRPASHHVLAGGLDGAGNLVAFEYKMASSSITNRLFPGVVKHDLDPFMTEGSVDLTYDIPNAMQRVVIEEYGLRSGYWRSVSHALNAFAIEGFMDELAHAAGRDPLDFRLALLQQQPRQRAVLQRLARESGWGTALPSGRARGLAMMESYETYQGLVAEVSHAGKQVRLERLVYVVDPGIAVHPDQVVAQIQSGAVSGLINTLNGKVTLRDGRVEQSNFHDFPLPRITQVPPIEVVVLQGGDKPGGIGEVGVPLVAPAVANAVFALTGQRVRSLPLSDSGIEFA